MSREYEKAVGSLVKDAKDMRTDVNGVIGAIREEVKDCALTAKASAQACITRRPFVSLLTALGVGVAIGSMLRWRKR
jgi:hypothetical protein